MNRGRTPIRAPVKDTYSTHEVAEICRVTPTSVIRWIREGLIPGFKTVGGHRRIRREDLQRVCAERGIPFEVPTGNEAGRILVVDHEPAVLELVRNVAAALDREFDIEVAKDAFDAGRLVVSFRPQLIFLDLMLPGVDGFEICSRLKHEPATASADIIVVAGHHAENDVRRMSRIGIIACLEKPLDVYAVRAYVIEAFRLREEPIVLAPQTHQGDTAKVLLITQNTDLRIRIREELSLAPTIEVMTAQTGADALLVAQAAPPAYVILSLAVPDVTSSEVIEKLASRGFRPQIIAVHDAPTDEIRTAARVAGARMCLPTHALHGSVRELLGV